MLRKFSVLAAVALLTSASSVQAAVLTLSQAELLGMTLDAGRSNGVNALFGTGLTAAPTFGDGQPNMSGVAGATANLNPFQSGGTAVAYYALSVTDLATFQTASAGDTFAVIGYNDNNQPWSLGVWYDTTADGSGIVSSTTPVAPFGGSAGLSLTLPVGSSITAMGVMVLNALSPAAADDFHASFAAVPEATSVAVWGGLSLLGLVARRRRG